MVGAEEQENGGVDVRTRDNHVCFQCVYSYVFTYKYRCITRYIYTCIHRSMKKKKFGFGYKEKGGVNVRTRDNQVRFFMYI